MGYSIFQSTMVDMTYQEIEESIKNGACAILPVSVVEEHGPHLCTGTDIYLTQNICEKIKVNLNGRGIPALIAPPFYWGINSITNGFVGSFSISIETMQNLLLEILENLHRWGIEKIFMFNFHGDFVHINKIAEVAKKAFQEREISAYFVSGQNVFQQFGLTEDVPYLLRATFEQNENQKYYIDIHAGATETSWMLLNYSGLVNIEIAKQQKCTTLSIEELKLWLHGGATARSLTPLGYFGNPADIEIDAIREIERKTVMAFADCIVKAM